MFSITSEGRKTGLFQALRSTGWRRTGAFNVLAAFTSGLVLVCCLIVSLSKPGSSLQSDTILLQDNCEVTRHVNIALHLVLNVVSSAVLASSNYFMQILNAPSRDEIDLAHRKLSSLEIGIPSLKNLPFLSGFKQCFWVLLLITSLPIHLFFNSAIYETAYEGSSWNLTIATEQFLQGAPYFLPGASLAPSGRPSLLYNATFNDSWPDADGELYSSIKWKEYWYSSYGAFTETSEYWNGSSPIHQVLSEMAGSSREGNRDHWVRLPSKECRREYCSCRSRKNYGDVVVIVDAGPGRGGWTRAEVYADPQNELSDFMPSNLDQHVPRDKVNSLWYYTQCTHNKEVRASLQNVACKEPGIHDNNAMCSGALGYYWDRLQEIRHPRSSGVRYDENMATSQENTWSIVFKNWTGPAKETERRLGYDNSFSTLSVAYCLANTSPTEKCKVNVANNLILVAVLCIFCKVGICTLVVVLLPAESLVTPGDAVNSFLCQPDLTTLGTSAGDVDDFHRLEFALPQPLAKGLDEYAFLSHVPRARAWQQKRRRIATILPRSAWWRAYGPIAASVGTLAYLTVMAWDGNEQSLLVPLTTDHAYAIEDSHTDSGDSGGSFGHSGATLLVTAIFGRSFLGGLMLANIGQLVLSWCYFAYNALLTRMHVEKELNSYSTSFKPLRVSFPEGKQSVTWRLQLPYKFGVPLLLTGILLHWLASNSIFLLIIEGGFWKLIDENDMEITGNGGLDQDSVVAVSYSPLAILITLVVSTALAFFPIIISFYRLPGDMVAGGCNSLVLSAACHAFCQVPTADEFPDADEVPRGEGAPDVPEAEERLLDHGQDSRRLSTSASSSDNDEGQSPEPQTQLSGADDDDGDARVKKALVTLAQSKLRWGVVPLTPELGDAVRETGQEALHLSFATEETFISPPIPGELYM